MGPRIAESDSCTLMNAGQKHWYHKHHLCSYIYKCPFTKSHKTKLYVRQNKRTKQCKQTDENKSQANIALVTLHSEIQDPSVTSILDTKLQPKMAKVHQLLILLMLLPRVAGANLYIQSCIHYIML